MQTIIAEVLRCSLDGVLVSSEVGCNSPYDVQFLGWLPWHTHISIDPVDSTQHHPRL